MPGNKYVILLGILEIEYLISEVSSDSLSLSFFVTSHKTCVIDAKVWNLTKFHEVSDLLRGSLQKIKMTWRHRVTRIFL